MDSILKVTPEKLIETAGEFETAGLNVRNITQEMMSIVEGFKNIWQGEAATGFMNKFNSLSDDMDRLYTIIKGHSDDLCEMAGEYKSAEEESVQNAMALATEAMG